MQGAARSAVTLRGLMTRPAWVRRALLVIAVLASLGATLFLAYELAMARVPQHRAALERLVRAHTGLDVSFNELNLRWGWYGPEAVFTRVELGEPGRSNVVVRAPQLVVGFDLRRSLQNGELAAGRVTLVAPDIDVERLIRGKRPQEIADERRAGASGSRIRILERWKGGRIDLEGGTLRLPDPNAESNAITVHVRRASLRRSGNAWNGFGLVFLPERLGRTARVVIDLRGELDVPRSLSGGVRFDGMRLTFAGWRDVFAGRWPQARSLPSGGSGDVNLSVTLQNGRIAKADGEVKAAGLAFAVPPWEDASDPVASSRDPLQFEYLTGKWRFASRAEGGQVQLDDLTLGRGAADRPLPRVTLEFAPGHVSGGTGRAPLPHLLAIARWVAPELVPSGVALEGEAQEVQFDWNAARPEGARLAASARVDDAVVRSPSGHLAAMGLSARLLGTEDRIAVELDAPAVRFESRDHPEQPIERVHVASVLSIVRDDMGWRLTTDDLTLEHTAGAVSARGSLIGARAGSSPLLDVRGTVSWADVEQIRLHFADYLIPRLGGVASRLMAGKVERGTFHLAGPLDALSASPDNAAVPMPTGSDPYAVRSPNTRASGIRTTSTSALAGNRPAFSGTLSLRDARLAPEGPWPAAEHLDVTLTWTGERLRAQIRSGRAGAFELDGVDARWDVAGAQPAHITGRAQARVEDALQWWREHPELHGHAPHMHDLVASGDAVLDFDVTIPPPAQNAPEGAAEDVRTRVAAVLENVQVRVASGLPPIESLRGTLELNSARLQRSTLNASWLGGPLMLRLSDTGREKGDAISIRAQGFADAATLIALTNMRDLPEISGQASWSGEFVYTPPREDQPARWQARAESTLAGIASALPTPLGKTADASVPLDIELSGEGDLASVRARLGDRVRMLLALRARPTGQWEVARGAIRVGGGAAAQLPDAEVISLRGHLTQLDLPAYALAWHRLTGGADVARTEVNLTADELLIGDRRYPYARVQAMPDGEGALVRIQSDALGSVAGTLTSAPQGITLGNLSWSKDALTGEGTLHCERSLERCEGRFELTSSDAGRSLADLGFRPELSAARGSLSGQLSWQPRKEQSWLQTLSGRLSMRFDDGVIHEAGSSTGAPFALLTVPALLGSITPSPEASAVPTGDLRFRTLSADFTLADGEASTSNLHLDGDAEILMRGRTGLVARDYDHEAWVLRGEERIPSSLRRLASAPRVAAAWVALRELVGSDESASSRVVLRLQGSWEEPTVTVD